MRYVVGQRSWGTSPLGQGAIPPAIKILLIANGAVYVLQMLAYGPLVRLLGLSPSMVMEGAFWQPFTYMFLHGGFFHILFNMFCLWMFGRDVENAWGSRAFMKFYLICGLGAGIVTILALWGESIPTIGASGAIFGVMLAFGMLFPNRIVYIWFVFPLKAKYLVMIFAAIELFGTQWNNADGIGHFTHLGGLLVGFIYIKWASRYFRFPRPLAFMGRWRARRKAHRLQRKWEDQRALMEAVDRVLDRINEVGYDQLTDEEKETLERASRKLSTEKSQR